MSGEKGEKITPNFVYTLVILAVFLLDQATKFLFRQILSLNQSLPVVKGVFHFTLVYNQGAAFGILKGGVFFFILTALICAIFIWQNLKNKQAKNISAESLALCLILAGGLGNLVDRVFYGQVTDFLDFRIWPVFNIADSAITIGAVLLGISILRQDNTKLKTQNLKVKNKA